MISLNARLQRIGLRLSLRIFDLLPQLAVARIGAVVSLSTVGWRLCRPRQGCCARSAALSR
jgi:hypothetical protein